MNFEACLLGESSAHCMKVCEGSWRSVEVCRGLEFCGGMDEGRSPKSWPT